MKKGDGRFLRSVCTLYDPALTLSSSVAMLPLVPCRWYVRHSTSLVCPLPRARVFNVKITPPLRLLIAACAGPTRATTTTTTTKHPRPPLETDPFSLTAPRCHVNKSSASHVSALRNNVRQNRINGPAPLDRGLGSFPQHRKLAKASTEMSH